jgi:hypothetical protein
MAYGNFVLDKGYDAAAAIRKFRVVELTANPEEVAEANAVTDYPLGVSQFGIVASELTRGKGGSIREQGITELEIASAITRGSEVEFDSQGRGVLASGTAGRWVIGVALEAGTTAGDRIPVMIARRKQ